MSKLNILFKFVGVDKNMHQYNDADVMADIVERIVSDDRDKFKEYAEEDSESSEFGMAGYFMYDHYLSNKLDDLILDSISDGWFTAIKEVLDDHREKGDLIYEYPADDTIKHIANILTVHMDQCASIIVEDEDLITYNNDRYIIFHIFIDKDLINQLNEIKGLIEADDDPFKYWLLSAFIEDMLIDALKNYDMIDGIDTIETGFEVVVLESDVSCTYVDESDEELPKYLS